MGAIGLARTIAYAVGVLLSLITLGVSAGASAKTFSIGYVDYYWSYCECLSEGVAGCWLAVMDRWRTIDRNHAQIVSK